MDIIENIQTEVMNMDISERLQELRKKEGYSQEQVAEMLGLSRQAISKWESGQGKPEIDNIIKLTEIYHVSADYILLGTEKVSVPVPEKKELSHEYKKSNRYNCYNSGNSNSYSAIYYCVRIAFTIRNLGEKIMERTGRISKLYLIILLFSMNAITMSGCVYVNNKNWDDMTPEEQGEVRQNFEEERKELEEDFSSDSVEGKFTSYILDKVEEGIED